MLQRLPDQHPLLYDPTSTTSSDPDPIFTPPSIIHPSGHQRARPPNPASERVGRLGSLVPLLPSFHPPYAALSFFSRFAPPNHVLKTFSTSYNDPLIESTDQH